MFSNIKNKQRRALSEAELCVLPRLAYKLKRLTLTALGCRRQWGNASDRVYFG
jgi:hypothetical protein